MNIEDSIKTLKEFNKIKINSYAMQFVNIPYPELQQSIETLLTAYEKQKEANKRLDKEAQGYLEELAGDGSMNIRRIQELEAELEKEKEKNKKAKEFIQENSHEFNCKRDDLIELEFDNNTNATDLIDILDGNW